MNNSANVYKIIWPQQKTVSAEQLIAWAKDDCANGLCTDAQGFEMENNPTVDAAIAILNDTGTVTFAR